jgi:hypothetical protein
LDRGLLRLLIVTVADAKANYDESKGKFEVAWICCIGYEVGAGALEF